MEELTSSQLVKYWLEEFKKEQPNKFQNKNHFITNLHHWLAEKVINNISLKPTVIKSVCDHEWMGLGINLPIRCKKCGEYSSTD